MATTTASNTNYYKLKRCFYKEHPRVEKRTWVRAIHLLLKQVSRTLTNEIVSIRMRSIDFSICIRSNSLASTTQNQYGL